MTAPLKMRLATLTPVAVLYEFALPKCQIKQQASRIKLRVDEKSKILAAVQECRNVRMSPIGSDFVSHWLYGSVLLIRYESGNLTTSLHCATSSTLSRW